MGDDGEKRHEPEDHVADLPGESLHADHQRRLGDLGSRDRPGDLADLGKRPGRHDHAGTSPAGHRRAGEGHVGSLAQRQLLVEHRQLLGDRQGLPGQQRFVNRQVPGAGQAQVGRDPAARFEQDDVTGNQLFGGNLLLATLPSHPGTDAEQALQGGGALFRFPFLKGPQQGVEQDDGEDEDRVCQLADGQGDAAGHQEDIDERAQELVQEDQGQPRGLFLGESIGAELFLSLDDLLFGKPLQVALQLLENVLDRQGMPVDARLLFIKGLDATGFVGIAGTFHASPPTGEKVTKPAFPARMQPRRQSIPRAPPPAAESPSIPISTAPATTLRS